MPTLLTKDIKRETLSVTDLRGQTMVVTLKAGDMLSFRPRGKRKSYEVPLQGCYHMALIFTAHETYKQRLKEYEDKRKLGIRARRPKKVPRIFSERAYQALKLI
jgi:hypothetical protein